MGNFLTHQASLMSYMPMGRMLSLRSLPVHVPDYKDSFDNFSKKIVS